MTRLGLVAETPYRILFFYFEVQCAHALAIIVDFIQVFLVPNEESVSSCVGTIPGRGSI